MVIYLALISKSAAEARTQCKTIVILEHALGAGVLPLRLLVAIPVSDNRLISQPAEPRDRQVRRGKYVAVPQKEEVPRRPE